MSLSKQRRWQLKRKAEGKCERCGKPRQHYKVYCDACQVKCRRERRLAGGWQPWSGHGGLRPLVPDEGGQP